MHTRGKAERSDRHSVAFEGVNEFAGGDVENVDETFDGTRGDVLPIGTVSQRQHELAYIVKVLKDKRVEVT